MSAILSRQNAKFKTWLSLREGRGIKKAGQALLSGRKLVSEFLEQHPQAACELLGTGKITAHGELPTYELSSELFNELDVFGTKAPLLVVNTPDIPLWKAAPAQELELIVALSDPGNLGAALRSAEAFGARHVILTAEAASPFLPKALRAGAGAAFRLRLSRTGPLSEVSVTDAYCLDMHGQNLAQFQWPQNLHLILGEEGRGVPAALKSRPLAIAMAGSLESLNAMAAASIAMFSYRMRWPLNAEAE